MPAEPERRAVVTPTGAAAHSPPLVRGLGIGFDAEQGAEATDRRLAATVQHHAAEGLTGLLLYLGRNDGQGAEQAADADPLLRLQV